MATLREQVRKREMEFETQQAQKLKAKKERKKEKLISIFKEIWREHQERRIAVLRDECEKALNRIGEGHDAAFRIMQNEAARHLEATKKKEVSRHMETLRFKVALQKERVNRELASQHRVIAKRRKSAKDSAATWQRSFGRFMSHNATFKAISKRCLTRELPGGLFAEQSDNHSVLQPSDYKHTFLHSRLFVTDEDTERSVKKPIMNAWKAAEVQREAMNEYNAMQNEIKNVMEKRKNLRGQLAESQVLIEQKMQLLEKEQMVIEKAKKEQQRSAAILQQSQIFSMEEHKAAKHSPRKSEAEDISSPPEAKDASSDNKGATETIQNTVKITSKDRGMLELSTSGGNASKDVKIAIHFADSNAEKTIAPGKVKKAVSSSSGKQVTSLKGSARKGTPRSPNSSIQKDSSRPLSSTKQTSSQNDNNPAPKNKSSQSSKQTPRSNISAAKHDQPKSLSSVKQAARQNEHKTKGPGSSRTIVSEPEQTNRTMATIQTTTTATRSVPVKTKVIKVSNKRGIPYPTEARSFTSQSPDSVIKSDRNMESKTMKKMDRKLKTHTGKDGTQPVTVVVRAININRNGNEDSNADREVKVTKTSARSVKKNQPRSLDTRDKNAIMPKTRQAARKQTRSLHSEGNAMEDVQQEPEKTQDYEETSNCRELVNTCRDLARRSMDSDQMDIRGWSTSSCIVTTEESRPGSSVANTYSRRNIKGLKRQDSSDAAVYKSGNTEVKAIAAELARLKSCSLSSMDSHLIGVSHMDRVLSLNDSVQVDIDCNITRSVDKDMAISPRRSISSRVPEHLRLQDSSDMKRQEPFQPTSIQELAQQVVNMATQRPVRDMGSPWSVVERDNNEDVEVLNNVRQEKLIDDSMNSILATLSQEVKKLDIKLRSVNLSKTQKSSEFPRKEDSGAPEKNSSAPTGTGSDTQRGKPSKQNCTYGLFKFNSNSSMSSTPNTASTCDTDRSYNDVGHTSTVSFGHAYLKRLTS